MLVGIEPYSPDSQSGTLTKYATNTVECARIELATSRFQGGIATLVSTLDMSGK